MSDTIRRRRRRTKSDSDEFTSTFDTNQSNDDTPLVRRRRTASNCPDKSLPEDESDLLPSDESLQETDRAFDFDATPSVSRRRTVKSEASLPQLEDDAFICYESFIIDEKKITNPCLVNAIDSIKAELREESRYHSVSQFWDDSHDWGESESSDYWHYLGSYE